MTRTLLTLLFAALLPLSFSIAEDVSAKWEKYEKDFAIDSNLDFGGHIYYNCRDMEYRVEQFLEKMGAKEIQVRCYGGIDHFLPPIAWESSISMNFSALRMNADSQMKASWKTVQLRSYDDCHLLNQIFMHVKGDFEIMNLEGPAYCGSRNGTFRVKLDTLWPMN